MNSRIPTDLRNILATLYPDERSIRRVVDDAGVDSSKMAIDAHAQNSWHSVLSEAEKNHQVEALLKAVEVEYGNNQAFQTAYHAYFEVISNSISTTPVKHPKTQSKPQRQWLPASIIGMLLIAVISGGWYLGIPGLDSIGIAISPTATTTVSEPLTNTPIATFTATSTATLMPTPSCQYDSIRGVIIKFDTGSCILAPKDDTIPDITNHGNVVAVQINIVEARVRLYPDPNLSGAFVEVNSTQRPNLGGIGGIVRSIDIHYLTKDPYCNEYTPTRPGVCLYKSSQSLFVPAPQSRDKIYYELEADLDIEATLDRACALEIEVAIFRNDRKMELQLAPTPGNVDCIEFGEGRYIHFWIKGIASNTPALPAPTLTATPHQLTATATPTPAPTYPCDAEIISSTGSQNVNTLRAKPSATSSLRGGVAVGTKVLVTEKVEDVVIWYRVTHMDGSSLGWVPAENLHLLTICPK